jgi:hypothetical protein
MRSQGKKEDQEKFAAHFQILEVSGTEKLLALITSASCLPVDDPQRHV